MVTFSAHWHIWILQSVQKAKGNFSFPKTPVAIWPLLCHRVVPDIMQFQYHPASSNINLTTINNGGFSPPCELHININDVFPQLCLFAKIWESAYLYREQVGPGNLFAGRKELSISVKILAIVLDISPFFFLFPFHF